MTNSKQRKHQPRSRRYPKFNIRRDIPDYRFEWVLAGHGDRVRLSHDRTRESLLALTRQYSRV